MPSLSYGPIRNDSKHNSKKPSLERAKLIFLDRLKGMASSVPGSNLNLPLQPILILLS